jgi:hypothetical protein
METVPRLRLDMVLRKEALAFFTPLLQSGVLVVCRTGTTLEELLVEQWGLDPSYVAGRITTLFLNSRAVDSVATTWVPSGSTVALSGAMPGLVGATMRRGGYYAAMRGAMTCRQDDDATHAGIGRVRVKLFNLLLGELGPGFLARGIVLEAGELAGFVREGGLGPEDFLSSPILDNSPVAAVSLADILATLGDKELLLTVRFEEAI